MTRSSLFLTVAAAGLLSAAPATAQGSDNCATPTVIAGNGPHAFDNSSATTGAQGQGQALCNFFGTANIDRDVWFSWTAGSTGTVQLSLCGATGIDSKVAVYAGSGCPGAGPLACNDDTCGLQSQLAFSAVAGSTYTIQLGSFPGAGGGTGSFSFGVAPNCPESTGPDVIVGEINGIQNYTASGGRDAVAVGTTSCNLGDVWLNWISSTNQHPVIGGAVYRFKNVNGANRFEQIGVSWLKHGFFALSENLCCPNCSPTDGTHLGVGCSDPYTAQRNGSQSGLGPRWQVNAHTGAFTYPPPHPAGGNNGRVQMLLADVEATGGGTRYFAEAQYVTPDDAAAGNQNNNASYHELLVSGGPTNFTFSRTGTTQRKQQALQAWQDIDPTVALAEVQVPGDGLFLLGSQVTDLGGGLWHYEYALYNMNADRNAGSFSVPIAPGVTVSNIGFRDVEYLGGDGIGGVNFSGLDWVATQGGGSLTWATETQAQNANANALRWGTTYNFRFDADTPPTNGMVTFGLWKAGAPASMGVATEVPSGGSPFTAFCAGDGTLATACPCGNTGSAGNGCANSANASGAHLSVGGSTNPDTVVLSGSGMPATVSCIYLQGDADAPAGIVFGDGVRCADGSLIRLRTKANVGGASQFPEVGDPSVSTRGMVTPGSGAVRYYQTYYRNAAAAFCPPETFNVTNGQVIVW